MGTAETEDMTLGDIVTDNAVRFPDVTAYRYRNRTVSHAQLRDRAVRLVSAMSAAGVRRQDRIAVLSRNSIEFGELNAAIQLSGIIMATINFRLAPPEIHDALRRVEPSIIFVADEWLPVIAGQVTDLPSQPLVVAIGGEPSPGAVGYEAFLATAPSAALELVAEPDDIAYLLFTSGTTGASKCCILGQREMRAVAYTMNNEMCCGSADRGLITMPMFHVGALAIVGGLHARGGTVVLQQQFDVVDAVRLIAAERITVLHLAPVMLSALLDAVGTRVDMESIRTVVYSAAPMTASVLRRAMSALPGAGFLNLYGQTEVIVSGLPRELHALDGPDVEERLRSVGFPFPGTRVRIVDEDGRNVPVGHAGEIVVRSVSMFRGYWQDPAATAATLGDGWCRTGDVGRVDQRGLLYLVDRKKDVIISGGENVYSPEVEDALGALDGVAACAVVGLPDYRWGETVCAVVVPSAGASPTLESLQDGVRGRLARYKVPRRLVLVADLPVLASGKVDKKRLRAQFAV
ncbi:class I adenylate-forming enzyme family protein [Mycolicibacterium porcinum]|uniref:AMP-binding protein n=1 Tax=Mycolicibacterium porcinum TaxID=39693 RepID=A0AAW5SZU8_9MYCO|nr:AMP-binding protein [Mycolicibacterium porcinum]MCV7388134.1 AMP-binding protein [Mycolicibacterium porcinum]ORB43351.1 AMP-dependent synthetase [Mycolicibacterium porcinum]CDO31181.1 AMP-dependent synthetase and ligase [Mycolicibacterium vulneris]